MLLSKSRLLTESLPNHLLAIAHCHASCFPSSLSTKLGKKYIAKTLDWFLHQSNKFLFHIEQDGMVVGYCGGFIPKGIGDGSTSGMLQHAFQEALIGVVKKPWIVFDAELKPAYPIIIKNIKRRLLGKKTPPITQLHVATDTKHAGLVVIGVHPNYRGTGIFEALMNNFFTESVKRGASFAQLSVKTNNNRAIAAYQKLGWAIEKEQMGTYLLQIDFTR